MNNCFLVRQKTQKTNLNRMFCKIRENYKDGNGQVQFFSITTSGQNDSLIYQKGATSTFYLRKQGGTH